MSVEYSTSVKYSMSIEYSTSIEYSINVGPYGDSVLHEHVGVHDGDQLVQQVRLGVKQLWSQLLHHCLQLLRRLCWHAIPRLGLPPAQGGQR